MKALPTKAVERTAESAVPEIGARASVVVEPSEVAGSISISVDYGVELS